MRAAGSQTCVDSVARLLSIVTALGCAVGWFLMWQLSAPRSITALAVGVCAQMAMLALLVAEYELMTRAQVAVYEWFGIAAASGSKMAITRQAFDALGGFRIELACNEDTELFLRAGRRGFKIRFDEHLVVRARDHRRLRAGRTAKLAHSLVRNVLLYLVCCQPRLPRLLDHRRAARPRFSSARTLVARR